MIKQQLGRRGAPTKFTEFEDKKLVHLVKKYGDGSWHLIAKKLNNKTPKQCHARWINYVNPSLRHGNWTPEEEELLLKKYEEIGPKWTKLASIFKNRPANEVRYTILKLNRIRKKNENIWENSENQQTDEPEVQEEEEQNEQEQKNEDLIEKVFGNLKPEIELLVTNLERNFTIDPDLVNHMI